MGLIQSFQDTIYLLKNTFVVIGKNPAALRPTIAQIILASSFFIILIVSTAVLFLTKSGTVLLIAMLLIVLSFLFLLFVFPFVKMYYRAAQCWIVYHTFSGNNISYKEGLSRARQNKWDIFILGLWDIILNALAKKLKDSSRTQRAGFFGSIFSIILLLLGKAVEEGWDLAGHYLLPASIIQEQNVGQALPELKNIKKNVPGALAGVFGFDFAGDAVKGLINLFGLVLIIIGFAVFFINNTVIPLIIIILFLMGVYLFLGIFVDMLKTVYFTLFYVSITMPMKILPEYRDEVTHYLIHGVSATAVEETKAAQQFVDPKVNQLIPIVQGYKSQGHTDDQILSLLIKSGWSEETSIKAIEMTK